MRTILSIKVDTVTVRSLHLLLGMSSHVLRPLCVFPMVCAYFSLVHVKSIPDISITCLTLLTITYCQWQVTHHEYEIETSNKITITTRRKTKSTVMFGVCIYITFIIIAFA